MGNEEKARVRWLDIVPTVQAGREVFVIRDPEGITDKALMVSRDVLFLLALMDGTRSVTDMQAEYMRKWGVLMYTERIASVIQTMDEHFLLMNERYECQVCRLKEEYGARPLRESYLSGRSYPADREELVKLLDRMMIRHGEESGGGEVVKGMLVPHIDYERGVEVYVPTYRRLPRRDNTLFVIFGTCHKVAPRVWNIAVRDLNTPLGRVRSAGEIGTLLAEDSVLRDYIDEWPHRNEHSIELQIPLIQFLMGERPFEVLSILTGSLHEYMTDGRRLEEGEPGDLIGRLKPILAEHRGPCVLMAAADLAHIGAQFGDPGPLAHATMNESRQKDQELLETVLAADASGFFATVKREEDRRRICGLAPIYFTLSMLDACEGRLVGYQQWTDGASSVSFAGAVFR